MLRTHTTNQIGEALLGKTVTLAGWVSTIRDHGGILFLDLRDKYGTVQLKIEDQNLIKNVTKESVILATGTIMQRSKDTFNAKIASGTVEMNVKTLNLLSRSQQSLPFEVLDSTKSGEDVRLKYRYLDLRNPEMQKKMKLRSDVIFELRKIMREKGFDECQTPILTASSPEGARDYLVPSRVHKGKFYALPQAPQIFKQLLMVAGMDKYFQIAPCFRDEDARADRSPGEFYQLDMEMSFATQEDVFEVIEDVLVQIFKKFGKYPVADKHFVRIPYKEAMEKFGTDKPDLRNPIIMQNLEDVFKNTTFGAFKNKTIEGFSVNASNQPRSFFEKLQNKMLEMGAGGLAWVRVEHDGSLKGPIVKFITEKECEDLKKKTGAKIGDDIFVIADASASLCYKLAATLRTMAGEGLGLIKKDQYKFCWIVDFPMFETDEETGELKFGHNPFSMPQGGLKAIKTQNPLDIKAYQYDIVLNGVELSSGAVRNTDLETMVEAFKLVGYSEEVVKEKFGALYTAFQYGVPPHAGIAPGVDRMVMLLLDEQSIREVVLFPMNGKAQDLMMDAPREVTEKQLREVHIKIR